MPHRRSLERAAERARTRDRMAQKSPDHDAVMRARGVPVCLDCGHRVDHGDSACPMAPVPDACEDCGGTPDLFWYETSDACLCANCADMRELGAS